MEVDPPSALTRFGMIFLAVGVSTVLAIWGVLKWLEKPAKQSRIVPLSSPQTQAR